MKLIFKTFLFLVLSNIILECYNNLENPESSWLNYTKEDSIEAKEFAIWLSGDLIPSDFLLSDLLFSLGYLRYKYGQQILFIKETRFKPPWVVTNLLAKFDDSAGIEINNNEYNGWNILNNKFRPDSVRVLSARLNIFLLIFDEMYHPKRLCELYTILPGIEAVQPNHYVFFRNGETFPLFPGLVNNNLTCLFAESTTGPLHYFRYENGIPIYVGTCTECDPYVSNPTDPAWLLEARENVKRFLTWDGN